MKAVENDFAKQTHCRLTVAEGKKTESKAHERSLGLIFYISSQEENKREEEAWRWTEPGRTIHVIEA